MTVKEIVTKGEYLYYYSRDSRIQPKNLRSLDEEIKQ